MILVKRLRVHNFKQLQEIDVSFPTDGTFLIEGSNEAGKSTLFEAIYFALFSDSLNNFPLVDLINYSAQKATVELEISVGNDLLRIQRELTRTNEPEKALSKARLLIYDAEGDCRERIERVKEANDMLKRTLKFDSQALLNSCFVEQKKLDKLEGVSAAKRREALSKLINLDFLLAMEERMRVKPEDERRLAELEGRYRLAEIREQIPVAQANWEKAERRMRLLILKKLLCEYQGNREEISNWEAAAKELLPEKEKLEKKIREITALANLLQKVELFLSRWSSLETKRAEVSRKEEELQVLQAKELALPELRKRTALLGSLKARWQKYGRLEKKLKDYEEQYRELVRTTEEANATGDKLREIEEELKGLEEAQKIWQGRLEQETGAEKKIRQLEAIEEWFRAFPVSSEGTKKLRTEKELLAAKREENLKNLKSAKRIKDRFLALSIFTALAFIALSVLPPFLAITPWLYLGSALLLLTDVLFWVLFRKALRNSSVTKESLQEVEQSWQFATAREQLLSQKAHEEEERFQLACQKLVELELPIEEEALLEQKARLSCLKDSQSLPTILLDKEKANQSLLTATAKIDLLLKQREALSALLSRMNLIELKENLSWLKARIVLLKDVLTRSRKWLEEEGSALGAQQEEQVSTQFHVLEERLREEEKLLLQLPFRQQEFLKCKVEVEQFSTVLEDEKEAIAKMLNASPDAIATSVNDLRQKLEEGQENVQREKLKELERNMERLKTLSSTKAKRNQELEEEIKQQALELGLSPQVTQSETIPEELTHLDLQEEGNEKTERDRLYALKENLLQREAELSQKLNLQGIQLVLEECQREFEEHAHSLTLRRKATEILAGARLNIFNRVIPSTLCQMQEILPFLTANRYREAQLTEDFRIRVWDERAASYREKEIFSGGTRDQFSLALRLAFAMATLPQERGVSPGFIFLDEPLSSFDSERTAALIELLTRGKIREAFRQVFVISHSKVVEQSNFDFYLRMENGRLVEENISSQLHYESLLSPQESKMQKETTDLRKNQMSMFDE